MPTKPKTSKLCKLTSPKHPYAVQQYHGLRSEACVVHGLAECWFLSCSAKAYAREESVGGQYADGVPNQNARCERKVSRGSSIDCDSEDLYVPRNTLPRPNVGRKNAMSTMGVWGYALNLVERIARV